MEGKRQMERLPPGFRFFPTDDELITYYLARKAMDASFTTAAIRDVDLYKSEPWDLPSIGGGDLQESYFFCRRSSRYPSGSRARRATGGGYWKSTGKDKGVYCSKGGRLVGTKKTLVFYGGRAPRGEKTSWVMHEYTMGQRSSCSSFLRGAAQSEWVICKVFMKKPASDHREVVAMELELELEETAVHEHVSPGRHHLPVTVNGRDGGEAEAAAPPPVLSGPWHTNRRSDHGGHEKERVVYRKEPPPLTMNRPCCASPSWLLHDDQPHACSTSTWRVITEQHYRSPDDLPDLLECGAGLIGGEADHRAELPSASVASFHLDEPYWNFGF